MYALPSPNGALLLSTLSLPAQEILPGELVLILRCQNDVTVKDNVTIEHLSVQLRLVIC